ncbi:MAG TPA: hypothetical protein VGN75_07530 [Kaistia sp.]|jgi:phage-related protein|nr:hypothetical protein [Kaistia sp.]
MAQRHLSVATAIEKNRIASLVAFVICLEIEVKDPETGAFVEMLRFVHNDETLVYRGQTYLAGNFDLDVRQEAGSAPQLTLAVTDISQEIEARMQQYGGGIGFQVRFMVVNTGNLDQPPEVDETALVVGASSKEYVATFELGAENPLMMRFPFRRQFRDRCPWRYKGPECGYTGSLPGCDYTLQGANGCAVHQNSRRFGGFPGIIAQ